MKKTIRLFSLVLAIGIITAMLASCTKTPVDSGKFINAAKEKEYTVEDVLYLLDGDAHFKEAFVAYPADKSFQIEFYVTDTADYAMALYANKAEDMEKNKGSVYSGTTNNGKNYGVRKMTSDGKFSMVEYVENTLVLVEPTDKATKSAIEEILNAINY